MDDKPWHHGGDTDVKTGRLLCPRHHTLAHAHDERYTTTPTAHGKLTFIRRPRPTDSTSFRDRDPGRASVRHPTPVDVPAQPVLIT